MHSVLVITSWWSNCLALRCLHLLAKYTTDRHIYVIQMGKSDQQMDRFREFLPSGIQELNYPPHLPADDSCMREYLALEALYDVDGAWFFDHDTFILSPAESWLSLADSYFSKGDFALCMGVPREGPGVTQPAFWLSSSRWPHGLSSFDPVPFREKPYCRRPDLYRHNGNLTLPEKDTLVQVAEELAAIRRAGTFPLTRTAASNHMLPPFPQHQHIGGIHLYTGPVLPEQFLNWMRRTVTNFENFFSSCPREWLAIEDPELLRRHRQFRDSIGTANRDQRIPL